MGGRAKSRIVEDERGRKTAVEACDQPCAIERGMRILGGKWTGSILWHLKDEPVRFNDLSRMIGGASKKMITERLRQLEDYGLVERRVLQTSPVAVEYEITQLGRTALDCLDALRQWSETLPSSLADQVSGAA
ncbi:MAG: helix-turn-helix domain-containing protein [Filomicrobium sp.]